MDGKFIPWELRDPAERYERMLLCIGLGVPMRQCPAVVTDEDRDAWERLQRDVDRIHALGGIMEIPCGNPR